MRFAEKERDFIINTLKDNHSEVNNDVKTVFCAGKASDENIQIRVAQNIHNIFLCFCTRD